MHGKVETPLIGSGTPGIDPAASGVGLRLA